MEDDRPDRRYCRWLVRNCSVSASLTPTLLVYYTTQFENKDTFLLRFHCSHNCFSVHKLTRTLILADCRSAKDS